MSSTPPPLSNAEGSAAPADASPASLRGSSPVLQILPGPYSAPMSTRAAARFARGSIPDFTVTGRTSRLAIVAFVGAVLVAAAGIGGALAFRFGRVVAMGDPERVPQTPPSVPTGNVVGGNVVGGNVVAGNVVAGNPSAVVSPEPVRTP